MTTKTDLHRLIDALPDDSVEPVASYLRQAQDAWIAHLDGVPLEDEEVSEDEEDEAEQARAEIARGEGIPWEQYLAKKDSV